MKRMISLLLAVVLAATLLPVFPLKAEAVTGGRLIALTFDDGPSSKYTAQLLDGLKERGVPVTFFVLGEMADYNPKLVKRAYEEGHEIACHTWNHPNLTGCSASEIRKEIEDTFEELDWACGDEADYLVRPPYGSTNQKVRDAIDAPLIYWSVDSEDWSLLNTTKVRKKIVKEAYDGAIILCHDIHKTTIPAALGAIDDLMEKGYEFVTVSELYRRRGRELENHKLHYNSKNNGVDYGPIPAPQISFTGDASGVNTVTITCADKNVPLYYTLNGAYPNQGAKLYKGPFTVPYGTTVTAVAAYKLNGSRSALTVKTADKIYVAPPTITLNSDGALVMTTPTVDSDIYFTIDDTKADASGYPYTGPEFIYGPCVLRAVTVHETGVSAETKAYLSENGALYYDIFGGQWFYEAMEWANYSGYLNGTGPYTMDPAGKLTRGMLVTLLYRFSGDTLGHGWQKTNTFADVNSSYYYAEAIEWAYRNRLVDGYSDTAFGPNDLVTRQQMCKIVASFLAWREMPLPMGESCEDLFGDSEQIADWAAESVERMVAAGLIQGDGVNLNPNDGANRAQFCVLLLRLYWYCESYQETYPPVEPEPTEPESTEPEPTEPETTDPEPTEPEPTEPEPTEPEPTEPEPTESEPTEPEPTDPEPTEPEPTEPEHTHTWKINHTEVAINVGERFRLSVYCSGKGCDEVADSPWIPSAEGVVSINGRYITGVKAGKNTWLSTEWEGVTYKCRVWVRSQTNDFSEILMPL